MLPRKLKNMNLFNDGVSFLGEIAAVTLPTLGRVMEEYRGGGMDGAVKVDLGQQPIEMEWQCGGYVPQVMKQYGVVQASGVMLRFAGAYQNDQTGAVDAVEVVIRGRHEEIERGESKPGEDTELSVKTSCTYYKEICNGETLIEIDLLGMVFLVNGVDRLAEQRAAIGM